MIIQTHVLIVINQVMYKMIVANVYANKGANNNNKVVGPSVVVEAVHQGEASNAEELLQTITIIVNKISSSSGTVLRGAPINCAQTPTITQDGIKRQQTTNPLTQ